MLLHGGLLSTIELNYYFYCFNLTAIPVVGFIIVWNKFSLLWKIIRSANLFWCLKLKFILPTCIFMTKATVFESLEAGKFYRAHNFTFLCNQQLIKTKLASMGNNSCMQPEPLPRTRCYWRCNCTGKWFEFKLHMSLCSIFLAAFTSSFHS